MVVLDTLKHTVNPLTIERLTIDQAYSLVEQFFKKFGHLHEPVCNHLQLSVRTENCLYRAKLTRVLDVITADRHTVFGMINAGRLVRYEVFSQMQKVYNLTLTSWMEKLPKKK